MRVQQAGEHLEDGRLARAVRAEEADKFALFDLEGDMIGRPRFIIAPPGQNP